MTPPRQRRRLHPRTVYYAATGLALGSCLTLLGYLVDYYSLYGALPGRWTFALLHGLHDVTPVHYFTDLFPLIFAAAGGVLGWLQDKVIFYSVNLEKLVENRTAALERSEGRYALAAAGANDALWDWCLLTDEVYYSPRWHELAGVPDGALEGRPHEWFDRVHPEDREDLRLRLEAHLSGKEARFHAEYRLRHARGNYRWMRARGLAERSVDSRPVRIAGSQRDIHESREMEEQLRHLALHDQQTDLPNRTLFLELLRRALERSRARRRSFAVLYLGLDRLRKMNENLGQTNADLLIRQIGGRIGTCLDESHSRAGRGETQGDDPDFGEVLARTDPDEFAILLSEIRSTRDAVHFAGRVLESLRGSFLVGSQELRLTAGIGIAIGPARYANHEHLLRDAHTAMDRAKAGGPSRCEVFDEEMREKAQEEMGLEFALLQAFERRQLCLWYQPIFGLASGSLAGFEALLRWRHAERGWISPRSFIPLAEESGLILDISRWAMQEAFGVLESWRRRFPERPRVTMNLNLSPRYLGHPSLLSDLEQALRTTGADPSRIHLEVTESLFIERPDRAATVLERIKERGFEIAMDDFGTGYSSLSIIHELPIDILKIDGRFVARLGDGRSGRRIVETIIGLAGTLGQQVVAEGIETQQQLRELRSLRCGFGQGFLLGRPMPLEKAERDLLAERQEVLTGAST